MNPSGFAVAIDGPVGVGKSTAARRLAAELGMTYIDTGAMYRAVALYNMRRGADASDAEAIAASLPDIHISLHYKNGAQRISVNGEDITDEIRSQKLAEYTSVISVYAPVREKLTAQQKELASTGQVVMDGRDIGSKVLPWAQVKIFLDANVQVRAQRRLLELQAKGQPASFARIWEETIVRDRRDTTREHAPLVRTEDAIYIDTTDMSPDEMLNEIKKHVLLRKDN